MPQSVNHVVLLLHSLDGGGAQRRVVFLADELARRDCRVDLVTLDDAGLLNGASSPRVNSITLCVG